jgi:hypothetical protein
MTTAVGTNQLCMECNTPSPFSFMDLNETDKKCADCFHEAITARVRATTSRPTPKKLALMMLQPTSYGVFADQILRADDVLIRQEAFLSRKVATMYSKVPRQDGSCAFTLYQQTPAGVCQAIRTTRQDGSLSEWMTEEKKVQFES